MRRDDKVYWQKFGGVAFVLIVAVSVVSAVTWLVKQPWFIPVVLLLVAISLALVFWVILKQGGSRGQRGPM